MLCSRSLMCHLRPGEDLEKELTGKLKPEELAALLASAHKPNYTCQVGTHAQRCPKRQPTECQLQLLGWSLETLAAAPTAPPQSTPTHTCTHSDTQPQPVAHTTHTANFTSLATRCAHPVPPPLPVPGAHLHHQGRAAAGRAHQQLQLHSQRQGVRGLPHGREPDLLCGEHGCAGPWLLLALARSLAGSKHRTICGSHHNSPHRTAHLRRT